MWLRWSRGRASSTPGKPVGRDPGRPRSHALHLRNVPRRRLVLRPFSSTLALPSLAKKMPGGVSADRSTTSLPWGPFGPTSTCCLSVQRIPTSLPTCTPLHATLRRKRGPGAFVPEVLCSAMLFARLASTTGAASKAAPSGSKCMGTSVTTGGLAPIGTHPFPADATRPSERSPRKRTRRSHRAPEA